MNASAADKEPSAFVESSAPEEAEVVEVESGGKHDKEDEHEQGGGQAGAAKDVAVLDGEIEAAGDGDGAEADEALRANEGATLHDERSAEGDTSTCNSNEAPADEETNSIAEKPSESADVSVSNNNNNNNTTTKNAADINKCVDNNNVSGVDFTNAHFVRELLQGKLAIAAAAAVAAG